MPFDGGLDEVLRTLAERVRRLREERGLTVVALAFEAGLSESRVRAIEAGRTTASLATLVALAETFEVEVAELFGSVARSPAIIEASGHAVSPYVVASEVIWGGELPAAPWLASASPPAPTVSPYVVPSEVVWGGELPQAPWTAAMAGPYTPHPPGDQEPRAGASVSTSPARMDAVAAAYRATEVTWGGAPSAASPSSGRAADGPASPVDGRPPAPVNPAPSGPSAAHASSYVFVGSAPAARRQPRTFADLREGALAGREFSSLREFAVAAVVEGGFSAVAVGRVFRLPVWRLERWVLEAGHVRR